MGTVVDDTADVWDLVVALLYQSWPLQVTKQQRDAQSWLCYRVLIARGVLAGSGTHFWEMEVTGFEGMGAAGQRRRRSFLCSLEPQKCS